MLMSVNYETTTARKKQWLPKGLLIIAVLMTIYLVLFAIRFCQLNFYGKHELYTTQIPATLHDGFLDSCWGGHYLPEDWERMHFVVQFVDFNGDFKTDFILYARDMIMVVKPAKNGKWEYIAFADCVGKFVYLPFTIFGKPKVWRFKTEYHDSGFVDWE